MDSRRRILEAIKDLQIRRNDGDRIRYRHYGEVREGIIESVKISIDDFWRGVHFNYSVRPDCEKYTDYVSEDEIIDISDEDFEEIHFLSVEVKRAKEELTKKEDALRTKLNAWENKHRKKR